MRWCCSTQHYYSLITNMAGLPCRQGIEAWIEGQISVWHKNIWTKKLKYREDKNVAISTIASFEYDTVRLYPQ